MSSKTKAKVSTLEKEIVNVNADIKVLKGEVMSIKWIGGILITLQLINISLTVGGIYFITNYILTMK